MNSQCQSLVPVNPGVVIKPLKRLRPPGRRGRPPKVSVESVEVDPTAQKRKAPVENEVQKEAFEQYLVLGEFRSLSAVAEKLKLKRNKVAEWSYRFKWKDRVREYEHRGIGEVIDDAAFRLALSVLKECFIPDPFNPTKVILDPVAKIGKAKDAVTIYTNVDKNRRENKLFDKESSGGGSNKGKVGFMVNFIIEK